MPENAELKPLVDDPEHITNEDSVLRVVQPAFQMADGQFASNAFQDRTAEDAAGFGLAGPCASVSVKSIWESESGRVQDLLSSFPEGSVLAEISVRDLRRLCSAGGAEVYQGLMLDPRPDAPWHAVVFGLETRPRSKGARRAIAACARPFPIIAK